MVEVLSTSEDAQFSFNRHERYYNNTANQMLPHSRTSIRRLSMSTLRTNALEGVDAKNSITIVAGAGNITTTNVQEGLAKMFVRVDGSGQTLADSFNTASLTDGGTGFTSANLTNSLSANWCVSVTGNSVSDNSHQGDSSTVRGGCNEQQWY